MKFSLIWYVINIQYFRNSFIIKKIKTFNKIKYNKKKLLVICRAKI